MVENTVDLKTLGLEALHDLAAGARVEIKKRASMVLRARGVAPHLSIRDVYPAEDGVEILLADVDQTLSTLTIPRDEFDWRTRVDGGTGPRER